MSYFSTSKARQRSRASTSSGYIIFFMLMIMLFFSGSLFFSSNTELNLANVRESYLARNYKLATTTVFWTGEGATAANDYIHNRASAWDGNWTQNFGGVDDPDNRCGYMPCGFIPQENPFYFALPYSDLESYTGIRKESAKNIPWYDARHIQKYQSILENHWIEIRHQDKVCYAQWKDVGPNESDDFAYVFGDASEPKNTFGLNAGLDVSPATRDCLDFDGAAKTYWRFVNAEEVPDGPWKTISPNAVPGTSSDNQ